MGCVNSRPDVNEQRLNVFQVINVDDSGNLITPGKLEVTDSDIVLYQREKQPIKWPLRCLRRYGYDAEIFSFESGRRCSTGPGIYAFRCRRATHLFNLVQANIQVCNNSGEDTISRDLPIAPHSGPAQSRTAIPMEPNYLDPAPARSNGRMTTRFAHNQQNGINRLSSIGSNSGLTSPQGTVGSPLPSPVLQPPTVSVSQSLPSSPYVNEEVLLSSLPLEIEHNNNKSIERHAQRSCMGSSSTNEDVCPHIYTELTQTSLAPTGDTIQHVRTFSIPTATYMNVDIAGELSPVSPNHSILESYLTKCERTEANERLEVIDHAYMNISPGSCATPEQDEFVFARTRPPTLLPVHSDLEDSVRHCYANLEASEIDRLRKRISSSASVSEKSPLAPSTPTGPLVREVNYAILDLDQKDLPSSSSPLDAPISSITSPPESPNRPKKGYATIDFNKTAALSHSVNPNLVNDNEGSRKTRHNSTISDLAASCRHSSSISE